MVAKGFRKKYFSLQAITATVSQITLTKRAVTTKVLLPLKIVLGEEDPPPKEDKPCFCNIFFASLALRILRYSRIHKPPLCRCRYTKTGIAPPPSNPRLINLKIF